MNFDEIDRESFLNDFLNYYYQNRDKIIKFISSCNNEFSLEKVNIPTEFYKAKSNGQKVNFEEIFKFENNKITTPFLMPAFINDIKIYLPKNIKKINMGNDILIQNIDILESLVDLETVQTDYLTIMLLNELSSKTNVKNVFSEYITYDIKADPNTVYESYNEIGMYKNIMLRKIKDRIDEDLFIDKFLENKLLFISSNIDFEKIEKLYNYINDGKKFSNKIFIGINEFDYKISLYKEEDGICFMTYDIDNVNNYYDYFISKGLNIKKVIIDINKNNNLYNYDYSKIDKLSEKVNLEVKNSMINVVSYEEFKSQIEGIKWYKKLIIQDNLSPLEKVIFAYDIMKSFPYRKEDSYDPWESRNPAKILSGDKIVCAGYTKTLGEILKNIDSNIRYGTISVECYDNNKEFLGNHSRSIIYIDDDKYNIHGTYILDPTWDSNKELKNGEEIFGSDYMAIDLYKYFLIPLTEYNKVFKNDTFPKIFENNELNKVMSYEELDIEKQKLAIAKANYEEEVKKNKFYSEYEDPERKLLYSQYKDLFKDLKSSQIFDSLKNRRISFSTLLNAIRNTRLHEGFNLSNIDKEMKRISRINAPYYEDGYLLEIDQKKL